MHTPGMTAFIRGELQQCVGYGFSILMTATGAVRLFGENLKLSQTTAVPQEHLRLRLILNLLAQPDEGAPSVNETTVREIASESVQFKRAFPRILQVVWEVDLVQGPVRVLKLDVTDAYHRGTL